MEPSKEPISVRVARLNSQIIGKSVPARSLDLITRESLLDALLLLYDECNAEFLKRSDKNVAAFVERYRDTLGELKQVRVNVTDFDIKGVIGRGHFAEVHVVKEKQTGDVYAMKTIKKIESCTLFEVERNIMLQSRSPWLTSLQYSFQDETYLFFVMDFHPGGDLHSLLHRQGGTIPETAATFYIAETVLALNDLHKMGYIHRDVKPDNILLDRCGHVKLADFGSAVKLNSKGLVTEGLMPAGTPDYVAPEVLLSTDNKLNKGNGYGTACDYWSLGVLAYELTIGNSPFASNSVKATYSKIMDFKTGVKFPADVLLSQAYITFVRGLLTEQSHRLNYKSILKHALFKDVDFNSLRDQVPPFVPKISSPDDTSNFSNIQSKKTEPSIANFKRKTQFSGRNLPYIGFTYTPDMIAKKETFNCVQVKNEINENLVKEINALKKKQIKSDEGLQEMKSLQKKFEEKCRKLESVESLRDRLEREAANSLAECTVLKRTIELERKERTELEQKALDLIKSAKQKWEASERAKIESLTLELHKYKEKVTQLSTTNEMLNEQLQHALKLENRHKLSLDKVQNLSRQSVVGLESRLERVTVETQSQITDLETKLNEEISKNSELTKQLYTSQQETDKKTRNALDECKNWADKHEQAQKLVKCLQSKISLLETEHKSIEAYKQEIDELKRKLLQSQHDQNDALNAKNLLEKERSKCNKLEAQIEQSQGDLKQIQAKHELFVDELTKQKEELSSKLQRSIGEKDTLQERLREAYASDENNKSKVKTLEELLNRLESGISKLECGSEREDILQEQIERLQQQLAELHGASAVDKQELAQLKTKLWRTEKDLGNAEIDKRILERELKELNIQNKQLQTEMQVLNDKMNETKKNYENALLELSQLNENLADEVVKFKNLTKQLEQNLDYEKEKCDKEKSLLDEMRAATAKKDDKISSLVDELNTLRGDKEKTEHQLHVVEANCKKLDNSLIEMSRSKETIEAELQVVNRKLQNSQLNLDALREACVMLENQLGEYEKIEAAWQNKQTDLNANTEKLINELAKAKEETQEARRKTNEEKSLKLLAETKCRHFKENLDGLQKECDSYKEQCVEYKNYSSQLSEELAAAEERITDYEVTMKSYERQIEDYMAENKCLKEEKSQQLTHLLNVKESNYKLNKHLSECKDVNGDLVQKINELEIVLQEKTDYYKERELKMSATIQQQTKLIDYLQTKIEDGKKKKTLSDKIFGSRKENQPPMSVALNYRDLENRLQKEQQQNRAMQEEIFKLKAELKRPLVECVAENNGPTSPKTKLALEQLVQSPMSQNNLLRQNSVQRMHHNIPHRFETKLCTKLSKCVQCSNQIILGRNMNVCKECSIAAHVNCSGQMPRTCGLPQAFAKHYSNSLTKLNDTNKAATDTFAENIEGWVKVPTNDSKGWEKRFARLCDARLSIYAEPNGTEMLKFDLQPNDGHAELVVEPVSSELDVPVANSDLPFLIKIDVTTSCWPSKSLLLMALSLQEKEKWFKALHTVLESNMKYTGDTILNLTENIYVNCIIELADNRLLLGTEQGLFVYSENNLIETVGPAHISNAIVITPIKKILMIADVDRNIIVTDLSHVLNLSLRSPCTKPALNYKPVVVNNLNQFHILQASDFKHNQTVCTATSKQLIIMKWDQNDFVPLRILDTAEPTGCILFTDHSVIVGADKFFEIDLLTFKAELFLDGHDSKLELARKCHTMGSYPQAIVLIKREPMEFLLCFNEFAVFVDEFGRSTRRTDLKWSHVPVTFDYIEPYLYVIQFAGVEIIKITQQTCNVLKNSTESLAELDGYKIEMKTPRFLGRNKKGIYIGLAKELKHVCARKMDSDVSLDTSQTTEASGTEQFSFTSSIEQSLDGYLSDSDGATDSRKRVTFNTHTDL